MLRVPDPSERLMLRLHYCKSRCVRPLNLFALSHVLFPLQLFNHGNLTPAVQPLINVMCSGLNRDHGTTRKESSSPSWIITNPLHSSFIPLDQPWPGYSTGFAFHPPFPFFSSPPWLSFLSCQSSQGKYSYRLFFFPIPSLAGIKTSFHENRSLPSIQTTKVCLPDSWFMWKPEGTGAREQGLGGKRTICSSSWTKKAATAAIFFLT